MVFIVPHLPRVRAWESPHQHAIAGREVWARRSTDACIHTVLGDPLEHARREMCGCVDPVLLIAALTANAGCIQCAEIELGIIVARLRGLLEAIGHVPVGRGIGDRWVEIGQHGAAASGYDNCLLQAPRNRGTKSWAQWPDAGDRSEIRDVTHGLYTLSALLFVSETMARAVAQVSYGSSG